MEECLGELDGHSTAGGDIDTVIPTKDENGKDVYLCDSCGALFAYSYSLLAHKRHKCHAGKGEFKCELCHKRFNFPSQLQRHMPTHTGEKPFQCHHCPKAFNESSNLKQHMLIHTDQKPFCCDFATCEKRFRSASNLKVHMRTHTKERPYICEYSGCGKRFVSAGDLKRHFRIHTKERPYVCQYCGKSFIQGPYLNIHIRSHTKEKPYTCRHCGKAFSRTSTLKIHLRLHTGEKAAERKKTFKCSPCDKTFDTQNNLQMHNAVSHAKQEPLDYDQVTMTRAPDHMYKPQAEGYHPNLIHPTMQPMSDNYSYMQYVPQSLMFDCDVPCGTLPNGQTVPLTGRNGSIIRPRAKRAEGSGSTPLSPDFIPQRDKMGMPLPMLPPLNSAEFFPPSSMLSDLGGDVKYDPKYDVKYDVKYDPKYDVKYDPKYDIKYEPKYDIKYDVKYEMNKIPPLVPVALPPPVNGPFNFLPPISHMHQDPLYPMSSMPMSLPMGMNHHSNLTLPPLAPMSDEQHDPHNMPGLMDMRHVPPPQQLGSVFKPYHHLDLNMALQSDEDEDVKPLI